MNARGLLTATADHRGMDRRAFVTLLSHALVATPLAADAQQAGKVYRIGLGLTIPQSILARADEIIQ